MLFAAMALSILTACAGTISTDNFNNMAATGDRSVQLIQTTTTALLRAKTITLEQNQLIQKQVDLAHTGIVLAKRMQASQPDQAMAQLTSALEQLAALKKQTGVTAP